MFNLFWYLYGNPHLRSKTTPFINDKVARNLKRSGAKAWYRDTGDLRPGDVSCTVSNTAEADRDFLGMLDSHVCILLDTDGWGNM